ncbi:SDR family NAD(P)-dependent oxidoreductase [Streptomyces gobiensis]|uniref:SDR family NAD(P)-dependent oxidoreductase n=1 Tax=Streptomyces gobiensis TaxID=2875706 RepID=UPI001E3097A8|nr:SDR family NAD(P)-dependent oxidoreductase [Streptomyces gobiensis]UGY94128.1 SDR family oxidoreductase [Streptomyces gobiensis]
MPPAPARFAGEVALVTGAARGIGAATAHRLAAEGATVIVNDLPGGGAEKLCAEWRTEGLTAYAEPADVTDAAQVTEMFDHLEARFGGVELLVNNAGIVCREPLPDFSDATWARTLDTNLTSAYLCLKRFAQGRIERGRPGAVVNVSSLSYKGMTQQIAYVASKGGVVSLTRGAALDLARHGIQVNCVAPGMVETRLTAEPGKDDVPLRMAMLRQIPLRRYAEPEEIAGAISFLLSDDASYITGETLHVSGGARL